MKTMYAILFQCGDVSDWSWDLLKYTDSLLEAKEYAAQGCRIEEVTVSNEDYTLLC